MFRFIIRETLAATSLVGFIAFMALLADILSRHHG